MPFSETLQSALDKVRGALSTSAQRDLIEHLKALQFVGVPAHAAPPAVREAVEAAWFERRPLRIRYRDTAGALTTRDVRIEKVSMERSLTLLTCSDESSPERRTFRLDRIEHAEPVPNSAPH
jgi:predicted DNA-binding transcriptional regulator YafY